MGAVKTKTSGRLAADHCETIIREWLDPAIRQIFEERHELLKALTDRDEDLETLIDCVAEVAPELQRLQEKKRFRLDKGIRMVVYSKRDDNG